MPAPDSIKKRWLAARETLAPGKRPDFWRIALFLFSLVLMAAALRIQVKYWVNIAIWDEWDTPGRTLLRLKQHALSWSDLWAQHNESRKFFPRLIYIALNAPLGWDLRAGMVLTFFSAGALSVFFFRWLRAAEKPLAGTFLAWGVINVLLFSPAQYRNFLCGFTFEILMPALALCGCVAVNLSNRSLGWKVFWNSLLAFIATYSFAHGMMLWALAVPWPSIAEKQRPHWIRHWTLWLVAYAAAGAIAVGFYFNGYQRPDFGPLANFRELPLIAHFVVVWLGAVVSSDAVSARFAGQVVTTVMLLISALSILFVSRNRDQWRRFYPWFLLLGFSLGAGVLTAIGRAHLGIDALIVTYRYKISSVFACVAMVGLIYRLYRDWTWQHEVWRLRLVIAISALATLLVVTQVYLLAALPAELHAFRDNRRRARTAVIWSEALPRNPELFHAYPYPGQFPPVVREMKRVGLISAPMIDDDLIRAISTAPPRGPTEAGHLNGELLRDTDALRVLGWAAIPKQNIRADYVVVGWQSDGDSFNPLTAIPTGRQSPLNAASYPVSNAGFYLEIDISQLPRGPLTFSAWSVDLKTQQAFPIDGTIRLDARPQP